MNKKILLQVVIGLLIVAGGVASYVYFGQNKRVVDCGIDQNCFAENLKTCTPAKIYGGATIIKGGSVNNCELYMEGPSLADMKTTSWATCVIDVNDYEKTVANPGFLKDANVGAYIMFNNKFDSCHGPYMDQLKQMVNKRAVVPKP